MRRFLPHTLVILFITLIVNPVSAQSNLAQDPLGMLQAYYNALNRHDYTEAFIYLRTDQTFLDFVTGFQSTERIDPYLGNPQSDNAGNWRVPVVVSGYHSDGIVRSFAGCLILGSGPALGSTFWFIDGNTLAPLQLTAAPSYSSIRSYLTGTNCFGTQANLPNVAAPVPDEASLTIRAYFDAISDKNYRAAYAMWLFPLPGPQPNGAPATDYRPPFDTFGAGYSATLSISLYTGTYQFYGASAGHSYQDGFLPVVLIGMDRGGNDTLRAFSGCYAMGRFVDRRMGIINGQLQLLKEGAPTGTEIIDALNIDCVGLGIQA